MTTKLKEYVDEITDPVKRKKLIRRKFEEIASNEEIMQYIDQKDRGWHLIIKSCCNLDPDLSDDVLKFTVNRAGKFTPEVQLMSN
ncbi:MAG: hypothetical protein WC319_00445 [Candidatus Paceibacterota bacterium]|jgi:hypothetical protein